MLLAASNSLATTYFQCRFFKTISLKLTIFLRNNSLSAPKLNDEATRYEFLQLTIKGSGFLWHQIRCIVALLCEIGHGNEKPEVSSSAMNILKVMMREMITFIDDNFTLPAVKSI